MPRPPSKKAAIEQAAMQLFASQGYAAATIKEIACKAEVTEGALYRHYASKEEMAATLFERELGNIVIRLLTAMEQSQTALLKLRAVIEALYRAYAETPWPLLFVLLNFQSLKGGQILYQQKNFYDLVIMYANQLTDPIIDERQRELLPTVLNGVVTQPIIYHYHNKLSRQPLEYLDEVTEYCRRLMGI